MPSIDTTIQSLSPGGDISLFQLDLTKLGQGVVCFVQAATNSGKISYDGIQYDPVDIEFEGLEVSGVGALPTPTISIANANGIPQSLVNSLGDLVGCKITRLRTFVRHLDGEFDADPNAFIGPDIFEIERKAEENQNLLKWELSVCIDQQGKMLPGRQVIRDTCLWPYREWNAATGTFNYAKARCPYTGSQSYDINDQPVANGALDVPSRRLSCCKKRFGANSALPFGGFPGAGRVRL